MYVVDHRATIAQVSQPLPDGGDGSSHDLDNVIVGMKNIQDVLYAQLCVDNLRVVLYGVHSETLTQTREVDTNQR